MKTNKYLKRLFSHIIDAKYKVLSMKIDETDKELEYKVSIDGREETQTLHHKRNKSKAKSEDCTKTKTNEFGKEMYEKFKTIIQERQYTHNTEKHKENIENLVAQIMELKLAKD
jgi:hypothetical protein